MQMAGVESPYAFAPLLGDKQTSNAPLDRAVPLRYASNGSLDGGEIDDLRACARYPA
jgi:hypothetical protein